MTNEDSAMDVAVEKIVFMAKNMEIKHKYTLDRWDVQSVTVRLSRTKSNAKNGLSCCKCTEPVGKHSKHCVMRTDNR